MDLGSLKKSYVVDEINTEAGLITVTYKATLDDEELTPITLTMGLPVDSRINDKNFVLEFIEQNYPNENFQQQRLIKRYDISEDLKTELECTEGTLVDENNEPVNPVVEGPMDEGESIYGDEYRAIAMRHLIIETLEDLGLIK